MLKIRILSIFLILFACGAFMNDALAYEHEVWQSGGLYYWKTFDVQRGSSSDLAVAVEGAMGSGNRDVHVITSGTLYSTINVQAVGVRLYCHGNTFTCSFTGTGISNGYNGFEIHDLTLRNVVGGYGIRSSAASNLRFTNVRTIDIAWIGMRIDSRSSNPWDYTIYNLYMRDCHFENCGSHGLETYSIDGVTLEGTMTARNCGDCGVLFNQSRNGSVGTVNAYNCCWGGGYAGLRFANGCSNITAQTLYADRCGRGFFIVKTGPTVNCHLNYAEIRECSDIGIWIENGTDCSVKSGCCESGVSVSGSGSYVNVSSSCSSTSSSSGGTYYRLRNRGTGLYLDGMGRTSNGSNVGQWANTTHVNAQWTLESTGGYYKLRNRATGLYVDGMGRTSNGSACGQWSSSSHYNQQWERISTDGYYRFRNRNTGLYLDGMGRTSNGSDCGQWANTSHVNSQWALESISSAGDEMISTTGSKLNIYPNPSQNGQFTIDVLDFEEAGKVKIEIYSYDGKRIFNQEYIDKTKIDLDLSLEKGIYLVVVNNGNQRISGKLTVQ